MTEHSIAVELKCNKICLRVTIRLSPKAATNNDALWQMCVQQRSGVGQKGWRLLLLQASGSQEQCEELGLTAATLV